MLKGGGRLSVHDGLLDVAWFCEIASGGWLKWLLVKVQVH
jgi:hypothetical protein